MFITRLTHFGCWLWSSSFASNKVQKHKLGMAFSKLVAEEGLLCTVSSSQEINDVLYSLAKFKVTLVVAQLEIVLWNMCRECQQRTLSIHLDSFVHASLTWNQRRGMHCKHGAYANLLQDCQRQRCHFPWHQTGEQRLRSTELRKKKSGQIQWRFKILHHLRPSVFWICASSSLESIALQLWSIVHCRRWRGAYLTSLNGTSCMFRNLLQRGRADLKFTWILEEALQTPESICGVTFNHAGISYVSFLPSFLSFPFLLIFPLLRLAWLGIRRTVIIQ